MRLISSFLSCSLLIGILSGCQSAPLRPIQSDTLIDRLALSPREDAEAEQLALLHTGEIVAPEATYQKIKTELKKLREDIPDSLESLRTIRFYPRIVYGFIGPYMNAEAIELIRNGEYNEWDSLNELFGIDPSDTINSYDGTRFWVNMRSPKVTNPFLMGEHYKGLDGVSDVWLRGTIGGNPSLYYGSEDGNDFFLIRDAWGDCPAGCLNAHYYLFEKNENKYRSKNNWLAGSTSEIPEWLIPAMKALLVNRTNENIADIPREIRRGLPPNP